MCKGECGTQTTMAPEVTNGDYYSPTVADVFSFGVTAVALLSPRTPDECSCCIQHCYYPWRSAKDDYVDGVNLYEDGEYLRYVTLHNDAAKATTPGPSAIAELLQTSEEHNRMPPAAVLMVLDRMLCIDPDKRLSAAEVVSLLAAAASAAALA